jgi:membrane-associated phospholipid phosphatase
MKTKSPAENLSLYWREKISVREKTFNFLPVDYIVFAYNLIIAVSLLVSHSHVSDWLLYFGFNFAILLFVLYVSTLPVNPKNLLIRIVRRWYFLLLILFIYLETGGLVFLYVHHWLDNSLAMFEYSILGVHPTIYLQKFNIPLLNEYFMFGYAAYFFLIISYAIILVYKKMYRAMDIFVTTASLTFLVCFYMFNFFPIAGPRFLFRSEYISGLHGYFFVPLVNHIIEKGAAEGGSMPSTHTAISVLVLILAWRQIRWLAYIYAPVVLGLVIGTFWGRFHYVSDTIVGFFMTIICIIIADWIISRKKLGWRKLNYEDTGQLKIESKGK